MSKLLGILMLCACGGAVGRDECAEALAARADFQAQARTLAEGIRSGAIDAATAADLGPALRAENADNEAILAECSQAE